MVDVLKPLQTFEDQLKVIDQEYCIPSIEQGTSHYVILGTLPNQPVLTAITRRPDVIKCAQIAQSFVMRQLTTIIIFKIVTI